MFHDEPLTIDSITLQTIQVKLDLTLILISFSLWQFYWYFHLFLLC